MKFIENPEGTLTIYGDSSEGKPMTYTRMTGEVIPIPEASVLYFTDTTDMFMYNDVKNRWDPQ